MTPHELRATLDRLDLSAAEAGHLLGGLVFDCAPIALPHFGAVERHDSTGHLQPMPRLGCQIRGPLAEDKVFQVAAGLGIDVDRLKADMEDPAIEALLDKNIKLAQALGITGTPGFVFGDEVRYVATDLMTLQTALQAVRDGWQGAK
jgi:protein-disulfide isomerase